MSWLSKNLALGLCVLATSSFARTHYFLNSGETALLTTSVTEVAAGKQNVELQFLLPALDISDEEDELHRLKAEGLYPIFREGKPEMLATGTILAVPDSAKLTVQITDRETRTLPDVWIGPCTAQTRCHLDEAPRFRFDRRTYTQDAFYPATEYQVEEIGRMQNVRWVRIGVNPIRWNARQRRLEVSYRLRVQVSIDSDPTLSRAAVPSSLYALALNATSEPNLFEKWFRNNPVPEKMLIITADSLKNVIAPFVEWKQARGIDVKVATFTEAGGTKENVATYVKDYYAAQTPKPSYLLFVGNKTTMPSFFESTSQGSAASDMRYALVDGTDNVPDMQFGRMLADSEAEATLQVQKWVSYERDPDAGNWYPQGTVIASKDGAATGGPSDKEYAAELQGILQTHGYQKIDVFLEGENTATYNNISTSVNAGRTWLTYIGHGAGDSWASTNDTFDVSSVGKLTNRNRLPILIDVACKNAAWATLSKCFGKAWITHQTGGTGAGAVGYYGGSVNISWHEPAVMAIGIAKYHFEKSLPTLGATVAAGQVYLVEKMGAGNNTLDNLKWYNLFGDPSLLVRTDLAKSQQVSHEVFWTDQGAVFIVRATDTSARPLAGLTAVVSKKGMNPLGIATTDTNGAAKILVAGISSITSDMSLTVTGPNTTTFQKNLP